MKYEEMFCTTINCMDGRTQLPVNRYMMKKTGADYVDTITESGPVKLLAEQPESALTESILERVKISIEKHKSASVSIVAHHDCAGNPASEDEQRQQLDLAVRFLAGHFPYAQVLALWVDQGWQVHKVHEINP